MSILEERFLARNLRNGEDEIGRGPTDGTPVEPGGDPRSSVAFVHLCASAVRTMASSACWRPDVSALL
jgi:hypothetical protein